MTDIRRAESVSDSPVLGSFTCPTTIWFTAHQPEGHSESHWPRGVVASSAPLGRDLLGEDQGAVRSNADVASGK